MHIQNWTGIEWMFAAEAFIIAITMVGLAIYGTIDMIRSRRRLEKALQEYEQAKQQFLKSI